MKKALLVVVLLAYTIVGPVMWLLVFIVTLPYIWKSVLSGKRPKVRRAPYFVPPKPQPKPPTVTTTGPVPTPGPVDIAAKIESGTMTPDDWRHVSVIHNREHKC